MAKPKSKTDSLFGFADFGFGKSKGNEKGDFNPFGDVKFFGESTSNPFSGDLAKNFEPASSISLGGLLDGFIKGTDTKQGASKQMQDQWAGFCGPMKQRMRDRFPDSDGDGVPDKWDCQPHNALMQDDLKLPADWYNTSTLKEADLSFLKKTVEDKINKASEMEVRMVWLPIFQSMIQNDEQLYWHVNNKYESFIIHYPTNKEIPKGNLSDIKSTMKNHWPDIAREMVSKALLKKQAGWKCEKCSSPVSYVFTLPEKHMFCDKHGQEYISETIQRARNDPNLKMDFKMTEHYRMLADSKDRKEKEGRYERARQNEIKKSNERADAQKKAMQARDAKLEKLVKSGKWKYCERCGGSGRYSWNRTYGDKCFGCAGKGVVPVEPTENKVPKKRKTAKKKV